MGTIQEDGFMPVRYRRSLSDVVVDRNVILDDGIRPTSKLLYVVLLALPADTDIRDAAPALVGVDSSDDLDQYLAELADAGLIETGMEEGEPVVIVHQASA
ncbi:hypothetical protein ABZ656_18630 [Streptomyces sp. NPDC007095]|uniref:hypothetical protein n=1 Tax=Streptomyces sp. NPDC007095 TaxID=3154482 RepID=UPI000C70DF35